MAPKPGATSSIVGDVVDSIDPSSGVTLSVEFGDHKVHDGISLTPHQVSGGAGRGSESARVISPRATRRLRDMRCRRRRLSPTCPSTAPIPPPCTPCCAPTPTPRTQQSQSSGDVFQRLVWGARSMLAPLLRHTKTPCRNFDTQGVAALACDQHSRGARDRQEGDHRYALHASQPKGYP